MISGYERHRKLQSRREFDFPHSGVVFRLRTPTELEFMTILGGIPNDVVESVMRQAAAFVPACLVGWSGIRACDIDPEDSAEALDFDPELIDDVLDAYPKAILPAFAELTRRYQERRKQTEVEVKNS